MILVAMPVQTLAIHGDVPKAIAIGLVEAAPFVLSTPLALAIGLGRVRIPPRTLLIADCVLRSLTFACLGLLAVTDHLTLPVLIVGLLLGASFRMAGSSSRRLLATSMVDDTGRFAAASTPHSRCTSLDRSWVGRSLHPRAPASPSSPTPAAR
jgi:hypothetical protein